MEKKREMKKKKKKEKRKKVEAETLDVRRLKEVGRKRKKAGWKRIDETIAAAASLPSTQESRHAMQCAKWKRPDLHVC